MSATVIDSAVVAVIVGAIVTVVGYVLNSSNEHRITVGEQIDKLHEDRLDKLEDQKPHEQFTGEEKAKIMDTCLKVSLLWGAFEKNIPLLLKNPKEMDELLEKISEVGISKAKSQMTQEEKDKLIKYLHTRLSSERAEMRMWASIYLAMLEGKPSGEQT
jgi:hypothetical protein